MKTKYILFGLLLFFGVFLGYSQKSDKASLESQRAKILKDLAESKRILSELRKDESNSLAIMTAIDAKVKARKALIDNYQRSVVQLNGNMSKTKNDISEQEQHLEGLKHDYAQMIRYAYIHRSALNLISYIFSSKSYHETFQRLGYLKKYRQVRDKQVAAIHSTKNHLNQQLSYLDKQIVSKNMLIEAENDQKSKLESERDEKSLAYNELKGKESEIRARIKKQQADARKLQQQIQYLIKKEMAANAAREKAEKEKQAKLIAQKEAERKRQLEEARIAREKAEAEQRRLEEERQEKQRLAELAQKEEEERRRKEAERLQQIANERERKRQEERAAEAKRAAEAAYAKRQAELERIRKNEEAAKAKLAAAQKEEEVKSQPITSVSNQSFGDFASAKGNLNRPVSGRVVGRFGTQKHPVFPNLTIENNGIDIYSSHGAPVHAAYDGKVSSVMATPGGNGSTILINHGSYFTVYTNLASIKVGNGSKVRRGQIIGAVGSDDDGNPVINFQVWKSNGNSSYKLNPQEWVRY